MADDAEDKSVQFIAKLVRLTQDREISWLSAPLSGDSDGANSAVFVCDVEGKQLRVRKIRREVRVDPLLSMFGGNSKPQTRLVTAVILEVLDGFGNPSFVFERVTGLNDLYSSASFSASGVADLMDSVLKRK